MLLIMGDLVAFGVSDPPGAQAIRDVFEDGHPREDRRALKDHRAQWAAWIIMPDAGRSALWRLQPGQNAQQRCFSAAARPDQTHERAIIDGQADVIKREQSTGTAALRELDRKIRKRDFLIALIPNPFPLRWKGDQNVQMMILADLSPFT